MEKKLIVDGGEHETMKTVPAQDPIKMIVPITPFLVMKESGNGEVVFVGPDGLAIGKDRAFNEEFASFVKSAMIRAKIAGT